jgi:hypothetical protein
VLVQTEPDDIETELKRERPQHWWRKWPDTPLAEHVGFALKRRARQGMIDEDQAAAKIAKLPRVRRP